MGKGLENWPPPKHNPAAPCLHDGQQARGTRGPRTCLRRLQRFDLERPRPGSDIAVSRIASDTYTGAPSVIAARRRSLHIEVGSTSRSATQTEGLNIALPNSRSRPEQILKHLSELSVERSSRIAQAACSLSLSACTGTGCCDE